MSHWRVSVFPPGSEVGRGADRLLVSAPCVVLIEAAITFHAAKYAVLQTSGPDGTYRVEVRTLRGRRVWHYHVDVETTRVARVQ